MEQRISYEEVSPNTFAGLNKTEAFLKTSGFDLKLLELIKYRVSQINGCAFCLDMHHKEAIDKGESELRLHSLPAWRECPYFQDYERASLAFAEALTNINLTGISDEIYEELERFYSKQEIATLTMAISSINTWNRINQTFRTVPGNYEVGQFA